MNKYYKEFLTYSYAERKGIIGLLIVLAIILLCIKLTDYMGNHEVTDFSQFENDMALRNHHLSASYQDSLVDNYNDGVENPDVKLSNFNPNTSTDEDFLELGLNVKQIGVIRNYLSKGGKFKSKEDFKKMYCINEAEYNRLSPYIIIPEHQRDSSKKTIDNTKQSYTPKSDITLELNSADTITLTLLHGIGSSYARRIIKYRDMLGGFINKEQLLEVFAFDSLHYNQIENHVTVNPDLVKKININVASFDDLKKHPYIKIKIANAIINYRKAHGNYKELTDLKKLVLMDDELFAKLAPYLKVSE